VRFGSPRLLDQVAGGPVESVTLRRFTDQLMADIAALAERPYVDRYVDKVPAGLERVTPLGDDEGDRTGGSTPHHW
jgi:hypothetical protein